MDGSEVTGYTVEKSDACYLDAEWFSCNDEPINDHSFIVKGLLSEDKYKLRVRAVNNVGLGDPCECTDIIQPHDRPQAPDFILNDDFKSHVSVYAQQTIELNVRFEGKPLPKVEWMRSDQAQLQESATVSTTSSSTSLVVENCAREDMGKYTLTIQNDAGMKKLVFTVKVLAVPGQVGKILCKEIKSDSVVLAWKRPEYDGCTSVDAYLVEKREITKQKWSKVTADCTRTYYRVKNLLESRSYLFRVTAINKFGVGDSLEISEAVKASQVPSAPKSVAVDEVTKTSVKVSWKTPRHDGGSRIASYIVEVSKTGEQTIVSSETVSDQSNTCLIENLEDDNMYDVRVKAVNDIGIGDVSLPATLLTRDYSGDERVKIHSSNMETVLKIKEVQRSDSGSYQLKLKNRCGASQYNVGVSVLDIPAQPVGPVNVMAINADSVTIAWQMPIDNGGSSIIGYTVDYR